MLKRKAKEALNGGGPFDMGGKKLAQTLINRIKGASQ